MIVIPEMETMPENCHVCPFSYWIPSIVWESDENWCPWNNCITDQINGGAEHRMSGCPLEEE